MAAGSGSGPSRSFTFQYYDSAASTWRTEANVAEWTLTKKINAPSVLEILLANPDHDRDNTYVEYLPVRIRESAFDAASEELVPFFGFVEHAEAKQDPSAGLVLEIIAKDGLTELADRPLKKVAGFPDATYSRRSDYVKDIILNHSDQAGSNPWKINASTTGVENSAVSGVNLVINLDEGSQANALKAVQDIAQEDPWASSPGTGERGYDFYLEWRSQTEPQVFTYFKRATKPALPAAIRASGLQLRFKKPLSSEGSSQKQILPSYEFEIRPLSVYNQVDLIHQFYHEDDAGNESASPATVTKTATGSQSTIRRTKVYVVERPDITTNAEAQDVAQALLDRLQAVTLVNGSLAIADLPRIRKTNGSYEVTQPGHLIYVGGFPKNLQTKITNGGAPADGFGVNMLVRSWRFSWPDRLTTLDLVGSATRGVDYDIGLTSALNDLRGKSAQAAQLSILSTNDTPTVDPSFNAITSPTPGTSELQADGTVMPCFDVELNRTVKAAYYEVRVWKTGESSNNYEVYTVDQTFSGRPKIRIRGNIRAGSQYGFQVRSISRTGLPTSWFPTSPGTGTTPATYVTASGDTTAPAVPSSVSANASTWHIFLTWGKGTDLDYAYTSIERSDNGSSGWAAIAKVTGEEYIDRQTSYITTKYYRLRNYDFSGNASAYSSVVNATTAGIGGTDITTGDLGAALMVKGQQPYESGITFTAADYASSRWRVSWNSTADNLTFADGTDYTIVAGKDRKSVV